MEFGVQLYVEHSSKALEFYKRAFNAEVKGKIHWHDDIENGMIIHAELNVFDQTIAISDVEYGIGDPTIYGNNFQIGFRGVKRDMIDKIYDVLKEDAVSANPPEKTGYSAYCLAITDKYGVNWCIFE